MKADSLNARDLFEKPVRYVIPSFQRPYVWKQDEQWEPFWEDVQHAADRYLEELDLLGPATSPEDAQHKVAMAEENAGRHFLGAVVVKQRRTSSKEIEQREVIDGQQRLTTMQLLLDAAEAVARAEGWEDAADDLASLILNDAKYAKRGPDFIYKVWPTSTDQDAFRAVMADQQTPNLHQGSQLSRAHEYFKLRVRDWVEQGASTADRERRVDALQVALLGLLEIVVIDLEAADDAFVIFETLNARGTPLLASDLVKNFLLQTANVVGHDPELVDREHWSQFDAPWWRDEVRQGRLRRPRVDMFLDYWLESRTGEEVASHEVFPRFKDLLDADASAVLMIANEMAVAAGVFRRIEDLDRFTRDGTFLYRWETMDAGVLTPLLLWVFGHDEDVLAPHRRTRLLIALESFLVRRMVNRMTTKQYNRLFLDVLKLLVEAGPKNADDVVVGHLLAQESESQLWPDDSAVFGAFLDLPMYRLITRGRLRMLLEALEDDLRSTKTEDQFVQRGKLTIEHVMPQSWEDHWPLRGELHPLSETMERNRLLHTMGNLTLATASLNSTISNHSWAQKREHLETHSLLRMTNDLLASAAPADHWDEDLIRARSKRMAQQALTVWPRGTD